MTWREYLGILESFFGWLQKPGKAVPAVPLHADWGAPTDPEEKWADDWLRQNWLRPDSLVPPSPRERYILAARFRHALLQAALAAKIQPHSAVPEPKKTWDTAMIDHWHAQGRAEWLELSRAFAQRN